MLSVGLTPPTPERNDAIEEEDDTKIVPFSVLDSSEIQYAPPAFSDTESHSFFVSFMQELPLLTESRASESKDPRHVLAALIGRVNDTFLKGIGEVRADGYGFSEETDWSEVIYQACQVLTTNPRHFFTKLETPSEYAGAPCSVEFGTELDYLKNSDMRVMRPIDVLSASLNASGSFTLRLRMEWSAALIKLINLVAYIFRPGMRAIIGNKSVVQKRWEKFRQEICSYSNPSYSAARFVCGEIFNLDMIIYETLVHIAMPDIHMSHLTGTLNLLWLAEYHSVRCAYDASSSTTLYVCLMSPEYLQKVWMSYMRMHYPRIFHYDATCSQEMRQFYEASPVPTWKHLIFYLPDKRQNIEQDPEEFNPFLNEFFLAVLTPEFRASFDSVSTPRDYLLLTTSPGEVFTVRKEDVIACRRSKRNAAPPLGYFSETRKNKKRRAD